MAALLGEGVRDIRDTLKHSVQQQHNTNHKAVIFEEKCADAVYILIPSVRAVLSSNCSIDVVTSESPFCVCMCVCLCVCVWGGGGGGGGGGVVWVWVWGIK